MKYKKIVRIAIILTGTLVFMWGVPALVQLATSSPQKYPFVYYSSVIEEFCFRETEGKNAIKRDASGRLYNDAQFDSIMPMLYYRQLSVNGKMPDSIQGRAVTMPEIRQKSFTYRYNCEELSTPSMDLYIMYESMPKRVNIESPGDVFRMKDNIEFVDVESNRVNKEKSLLFATELDKRRYTFPAQWLQGLMTNRKPYDEGYFSLDATGQLFHIKMVNDRPFIRNTHVSDSMDVVYFSMLPVSDKRFYGFLYDSEGYIYILESPTYQPRKVDIPPVNLHEDRIMIMANMFFWTVYVNTPEGRYYYALDNDSLQRVDQTFIAAQPGLWDKTAAWLFPVYLTFEDRDSKYLNPEFHFTSWIAFIMNILAALLFFIFARKKRKCLYLQSGYVLLTGIAGLLSVLIIPDNK
ncbi:MAG: DUF4857 domain-containing protein [Bacteroidales bacterium]|jgi:hypothetical protein|nr:DUF4857 domain-containing protein [Bacteroidales bacterium]